MRLKNNPKAKPAVESSHLCIQDPFIFKDNWKDSFSANKPVFIEIGCGKGQFLYDISRAYPDRYFLGIEIYESVLIKAINKWADETPDNLRFICLNAEKLYDVFSSFEIDGIYLNFSDPWPKNRHAKRRLTSPVFLALYHNILKPGGLIEFKTDNNDLFDYSLETIEEDPFFEIISYTRDLYNEGSMIVGNIPTEYETKFHNKGNKINKLIARHLENQ